MPPNHPRISQITGWKSSASFHLRMSSISASMMSVTTAPAITPVTTICQGWYLLRSIIASAAAHRQREDAQDYGEQGDRGDPVEIFATHRYAP